MSNTPQVIRLTEDQIDKIEAVIGRDTFIVLVFDADARITHMNPRNITHEMFIEALRTVAAGVSGRAYGGQRQEDKN